mgnify:CR=1 FL=1
MTYLREIEQGLAPRITSPFDILVRNFFDTESPFHPLQSIKLKHPVDVYDILKVSYTKPENDDNNREYHYSGIAKRSFNFGYKVANKFRLSDANAKMENGLLTITVPYAPHIVTKPLSIKKRKSHPKLVLLIPFYYIIYKIML